MWTANLRGILNAWNTVSPSYEMSMSFSSLALAACALFIIMERYLYDSSNERKRQLCKENRNRFFCKSLLQNPATKNNTIVAPLKVFLLGSISATVLIYDRVDLKY